MPPHVWGESNVAMPGRHSGLGNMIPVRLNHCCLHKHCDVCAWVCTLGMCVLPDCSSIRLYSQGSAVSSARLLVPQWLRMNIFHQPEDMPLCRQPLAVPRISNSKKLSLSAVPSFPPPASCPLSPLLCSSFVSTSLREGHS